MKRWTLPVCLLAALPAFAETPALVTAPAAFDECDSRFIAYVGADAYRFSPAHAGELGSVRNMDATHAKNVLGWQTRPVEDSLADCARSLIEQGVVKV